MNEKIGMNWNDRTKCEPEKEGWYLVWAPEYWSVKRQPVDGGFLWCKYRPNHKMKWSIEEYWPKPFVKYWMEIEKPE